MLKAIICSRELEKQNQEINIPVFFPLTKESMDAVFDSATINSVEDCLIVDAVANKSTIDRLLGKLDLSQNTLLELDYFNQCIDSMGKKNLTNYFAALDLCRPNTLKEAINLTANLDQIHVIPEIDSLQELGEFLYDNNMTEMDRKHTGKTTLDGFGVFDYTEIAKEHLMQNNAQISYMGYIEDNQMASEYVQIYDGVTLPQDYKFLQEQSGQTVQNDVNSSTLVEFKFYSKINIDCIDPNADYYDGDYWCDLLSDYEAVKLAEDVNMALKEEFNTMQKEQCNFMDYLYADDDGVSKSVVDKVKTALLSAEVVDNKLYAVMTCRSTEPLNEMEIDALQDNFTGQYSDGFGESLEQHGHDSKLGEIYIKLWNSDNFNMFHDYEFNQQKEEQNQENIEIEPQSGPSMNM